MNPILWTKDGDPPYYRLDLEPTLEKTVEELFDDAAVEFLEGVVKYIPFDAGYTVKEGECFEITDFPIDEELLTMAVQPLTGTRVSPDDLRTLKVKALIGYQVAGTSRSLFFQNFNGSKVIVPGKRVALFSVADSSTFQELKRPVVLLDSNVNAIWENGRLLFKSFHMAKQMLDLSEYFQQASDEQLNLFAGHKLLDCGNMDAFKAANNYWTRTKIAMILAAKTLDNVTPKEMSKVAKEVKYELIMKNGKVVIPEEPDQMRDLLHFLDEELYVGYFTKKPYLTNSKRAR